MLRRLAIGALAALALAVVSVGFGSRTASAEVVYNDVVPVTFTLDNPCQAGNDVVVFSGFTHALWYTTPEGSTIMRYTAHYTGTDSNGVQYVENNSRTMEHEIWPTYAPFSDEVTLRMVSKGSTANATIRITLAYSSVFVPFPAPPYVVSATCTG